MFICEQDTWHSANIDGGKSIFVNDVLAAEGLISIVIVKIDTAVAGVGIVDNATDTAVIESGM